MSFEPPQGNGRPPWRIIASTLAKPAQSVNPLQIRMTFCPPTPFDGRPGDEVVKPAFLLPEGDEQVADAQRECVHPVADIAQDCLIKPIRLRM